MTYRVRDTWMDEEDLVLTKTLGQRIEYVRKNLVDEHGVAMTQAAFATRTGLTKGHHGVMRWEKDTSTPKDDSARLIAAAAEGANYRPAVFSLRGAEALVVEIAVPLLRSLEADLAETAQDVAKANRELSQLRARVRKLEARPSPGANPHAEEG